MLNLKNNITMKKLIIAITFIFAATAIMPLMGQSTAKEAEKDLKKKSMKMARKEAKKKKKAGYYVAPGALPMDKQLEKAFIKQNMEDDKGYPTYIVASGNSVAGTQTAAKLQATETAKLTLAGTISTNVAALIENSIANEQLTREEAATVTKTVAASKNIIAQNLGRVIPLVEMYKNIGSDNIQCDVQIAYDSKTAMDMAKQVIRKQLEEQTDILHEKLDKMLDIE
ncbi:MAG: hypothetical protein DRI89_11325 [Bacteroidetes bacterium]|nr:MAG: hypothetical protein DRI89_11325 [Bacteroidota bacterium]